MSRWMTFILMLLAAALWWTQGDPAALESLRGGAVERPVAAERQAGRASISLPAEAYATLRRIERGGPHPYRQDGTVFFNREGRLPSRPQGYYREYTVDTPGLSHRGARRIVTGGQPPVQWYYTDDHYQSFRPFTPP